MPPLIKQWLKYPPNTSTPMNDVAMKALEARTSSYVGAQNLGPGVNGFSDFIVGQTGVASMVLNIGVANVLNSAFISWDVNGSPTRYDYSAAQLIVNVTAADPTNPRIDRVILTPTIDQSSPSPSILVGTPTGGATLDNLTGAQAIPVGSLLLADVLVAAAATSITQAAIQDRRPVTSYAASSMGSLDAVSLIPDPCLPIVSNGGVIIGSATQYAILVTLRRRIVGATRIRWKYVQNATPMAGTVNMSIYEPGGRKIIETGPQALTGGANAPTARQEPIAATTFEAGQYVFAVGWATTGSTALYDGVRAGIAVGASAGAAAPGVAFGSSTGGTTLPQRLLTTFADMYGAGVNAINDVPLVALSVG